MDIVDQLSMIFILALYTIVMGQSLSSSKETGAYQSIPSMPVTRLGSRNLLSGSL